MGRFSPEPGEKRRPRRQPDGEREQDEADLTQQAETVGVAQRLVEVANGEADEQRRGRAERHALGGDDDGVAAMGEPLGEHIDHSTVAVQRERHLGNEAQVPVGSGQRGVGGDEAGVATHQLHQSDPASASARRQSLAPRRA